MGEARRIVRDALNAADALDGLVRAHVTFALTETDLITVYDQEAHNLDDANRRRLCRQQRAYTELWIDELAKVVPDEPHDALRVVVQGVFGLVNSVADHHVRLAGDGAADLLGTMARASLAPMLEGRPSAV